MPRGRASAAVSRPTEPVHRERSTLTSTRHLRDHEAIMVRLWVSLGFVAMTAWSAPAWSQSAEGESAAEATPVDEAAPAEGGADEAEPEEATTPEAHVVDGEQVPPGAADEALIDLTERDEPTALPDAYPAAAAPPAPAYVPPARAGLAPPIPPAPLTEDELPRRSIGMMVTGIVLTSLGAITALTGAAIAGEAEECEDEECRRVNGHRFGVGLGIGGLAVIGAGIPLLVVGAQRVTPEAEASVSLSLGPASFRLRSEF